MIMLLVHLEIIDILKIDQVGLTIHANSQHSVLRMAMPSERQRERERICVCVCSWEILGGRRHLAFEDELKARVAVRGAAGVCKYIT